MERRWSRGSATTAALAIAALAPLAGTRAAQAQTTRPTWTAAIPAPGVVDLTPPDRRGRFILTAGGLLSRFDTGAFAPLARGPSGYASTTGEPYIALATGRANRSARCTFTRGDVYAIEPSDQPAIIRVDSNGVATRFAPLPQGTTPSGIAFDDVGHFGFRLLVTATRGRATALVAVDCRGRARELSRSTPLHVEGGMAVAPRTFGRFGGQLIAPDELSGRIVRFDARGRARTLARSGLPAGADIGVESLGFLPLANRRARTALLADRGGQAEPHPGSDAILAVSTAALRRAGARPGDLLAATEGGALTVAVRCGRTCRVRRIADGPAIAHAEGHIVFSPDTVAR
jgi:hypothetical protein